MKATSLWLSSPSVEVLPFEVIVVLFLCLDVAVGRLKVSGKESLYDQTREGCRLI